MPALGSPSSARLAGLPQIGDQAGEFGALFRLIAQSQQQGGMDGDHRGMAKKRLENCMC